MVISRRFVLCGSLSMLTLPSPIVCAQDDPRRRPNPRDFEFGDMVWPKKPGAFVPYASQLSLDTNEERERWTREKEDFLARVRSGDASGSNVMADQLDRLTYDEFRARYLRDLDPTRIIPFSSGSLIAVGHVGIIEIDASGTPWVIEALLVPGVVRQRYSSWLDARQGEIVWHGRLLDFSKERRATIATEATKYIAKPYNFWNLNLTDDTEFYCSKLVWLSIMRALNTPVDGNSDARRSFWLSPKQVLYSAKIVRLVDPGSLRNRIGTQLSERGGPFMIKHVLCMTAGVSILSAFGFAQTTRLEAPTQALVFVRSGVTVPTTLVRKQLTQGSGFLIDSTGHIVTARHVVLAREAEEPGPRWVSVSLRTKNSSPISAQLVACENYPIDLCLLKIADEDVTASGIRTFFVPVCRKLSKGEKIVAFGYPSGLEGSLRARGEVNGDLVGPELTHPSDVAIQPGMSGGPVLDESGRVIAVNTGAGPIPTLTFLQPLSYSVGLVTRAGVPCPMRTDVTVADPSKGPAICGRSQTALLQQAAWNYFKDRNFDFSRETCERPAGLRCN